MSLEVDVYGPTVEKAADDLIEAGRVGDLLDLIDDAGGTDGAAGQLWAQLMTPSQLWRLLEGGNVDEDSLGRVIRGMGEAAIPPLLDTLTESESRSLRRKIFDYLADMGPEAGKAVITRLDDDRWFVARNVLAILNRMQELPEGFDPLDYIDHEDPRVRREALPLALSHGSSRAAALAAGVLDEDERLCRLALLEIQEGPSDSLLSTLVNRVVRSERPPELRALAVRAFGNTGSPLVLEVLLEVASTGKTLFGRRKIAGAAPDVIEALRLLRTRWSDDAEAAAVLRAARSSRNAEVRDAAWGEGLE